ALRGGGVEDIAEPGRWPARLGLRNIHKEGLPRSGKARKRGEEGDEAKADEGAAAGVRIAHHGSSTARRRSKLRRDLLQSREGARKFTDPGTFFAATALAPQRSMLDNGPMSVWSRIVELAARAFDPEAEPPVLGQECAPLPNDVGFTAAVIGLA